MAKYRVTYQTHLHLTVDVEVEPPEGADPEDFDFEDAAQDRAQTQAEEYVDTLLGDHRGLRAEASLDGVGAETVEEVFPS